MSQIPKAQAPRSPNLPKPQTPQIRNPLSLTFNQKEQEQRAASSSEMARVVCLGGGMQGIGRRGVCVGL